MRCSTLPCAFAGVFWSLLWSQDLWLFASCLLPFVAQLICLLGANKLSFKAVGLLETASMLWVTGVIWFGVR